MSKTTIEVGQLSAARGEKCYGTVTFSVCGQPYALPLWLIHGEQDGPTLVVTGGVHAAEYASIAAALDLGRSLEPKAIRGRVIVVPVVNMPGFTARSIYVCPLDGKNPNRVFPGNPNGTATEQLADWLFRNVIKQADYYVDMHGGDLIEALAPFTIFAQTGKEEVDAASRKLAEVFGLPYIVASKTPGSTIAAAGSAGIPAILTESGGQGIWTPEHVADHTRGLDRLMRHLGMLDGEAPEAVPTSLFDQFVWARSEHEGFWYPQVAAGETVRAGQPLGCIRNAAGDVLQRATTPEQGIVLFIVSSLAINPNDPLFAVGH
jgi:predicted deacylase